MSWFKKLFNTLEGKKDLVRESPSKQDSQNLSEDKESFEGATVLLNNGFEDNLDEEIVKLIPAQKSTEEPQKVHISNKNDSSNIIELEEISVKSIIRKMKVLSFADTKVSGIDFHFRGSKNSPDGLAGKELFTNTDFRQSLFRELEGNAIQYDPDMNMQLVYNSESIDQHTLVNRNISFNLVTPIPEKTKKFNAVFTILKGFAWQEKYTLKPEPNVDYFVGRGKEPQLDNGIVIKNTIAFISVDEEQDEKNLINNYISRSIALIYYDESRNEFIIKRSGLMNNSKHILKVVSVSRGGLVSYSLNNTTIEHVLKDGDNIIVNDKISMRFQKDFIDK